MAQPNLAQPFPRLFPLEQDKDFISESEWVIWKLLCRPLSSLPESTAEELSALTGGQIGKERCQELINIVNISTLSGLGTWISRLLAESGYDVNDVCDKPAATLLTAVNDRLGYQLCNDATISAFENLQIQWRAEEQAKQAE